MSRGDDLMRLAVFFVILTLSQKAYGFDCTIPPFDRKPVVGALAPSKARNMIVEQPSSLTPEILQLADNNAKLAEAALLVGLNIQSRGNESMIYNLDSLIWMTRGNYPEGTEEQKALYKLYLASNDPDQDYYSNVQFSGALRIVGTLALLGRNDEAKHLLNYMSQPFTAVDPNALYKLRMLMSNTGRIPTATNSIQICESIQALQIR